jgi:prepilin-type N-terminal cleavage/methylation domain-containing protein
MSDPRKSARGFSLVELAVVLAIIMIGALIGLPAFFEYLERQRLISAAHEAAMLLRQTRFEAIKRSVRAGVKVEYDRRELIAFADLNSDGLPQEDEVVGKRTLPTGVNLWGPTDVDDGGVNASSGFDENGEHEGTAMFIPDGSVKRAGAFRLKNNRDDFLEVRIETPATGRVVIQKWFGGGNPEGNWYEDGESGNDWDWDEG